MKVQQIQNMFFILFLVLGLSELTSTVNGQCLANCPDGWTRFQGSCYYVGYEHRLNFAESARFCQQHGAHFVHIGTTEENIFIKDLLKRTRLTGFAWIGITDKDDEGVWRWHSNGQVAQFLDWNPGEPNDKNGPASEDCADMEGPSYTWHDVSCSGQLHPLCEINMADETTDVVG